MRRSTAQTKAVCAVLALAVAVPASILAQPVQEEVVSPHAQAEVTVDGLLAPQEWVSAVEAGPMLRILTGDEPAEGPTTARLMHDGQALYIAFACTAAEPTARAARLPRDDEAIWREDHVEVFLDATPDTDDYAHFVVDRAGNVLDARHAVDEGSTETLEWRAQWSSATRNTASGWSCEVRIPYSSLGAAAPQPGDLWRLKLCRDGGPDGPIMWPGNPTDSFHSRTADGALYFDKQNLLVNGDFEEGPAGQHAPAHWTIALTSSEVNNEPQGQVRTIEGGAEPGARALWLKKLGTALWWPQVWNSGYKLQPEGLYEFSILAKGTMAQVNLRATARMDGDRVKMSRTVEPTDELSRLRMFFVVPLQAVTVDIGLSAPAGMAGETVYDNAILRRVLRAKDALERKYYKPDWSPDPDPVHGLQARGERAGHKPWPLHWRGDHLISHRVIFKDRMHGTELWMLDDSPVTEYGVTASIWPGWNCQGSVLMVRGRRFAGDVTRSPWLFNADYSSLSPMSTGGMPLWDLQNPDVYYLHEQGKATKVNFRTGEQTTLATWEPRGTERSYGLTKDNKSIWVVDWDGGEWLPWTPGEDRLPVVRVLDCYGPDPEGEGRLASLYMGTETASGPKLRVMIGTRVYTDTGRTERLIVPITGHTEYLQAFVSGRVQFPDHTPIPATKDLAELFDIYHLYPSCSHGHLSYSPDGEYTCWDGALRCYRTRDGEDLSEFDISPNGSCYHTCWFRDARFFVSCVRGYRTAYDRPVNGNIMCQAFTDGTWQPICDIKMRPNAFYYGGNFATLSTDATKVHYASSMTGVFKNYIAVMARPQPPRQVDAQTRQGGVLLTWSAPPHHKEIKGTLVYRSETSGDGYELLTPEPISNTQFEDTSAQPGRPQYYVLTSLEHSGLESGYSAEVRAAASPSTEPGEALVCYAEAEAALCDLPSGAKPGLSMGRDRLTASNWYYVYRSPSADHGTADVPLQTAARGRYFLWLRIRSANRQRVAWSAALDGSAVGDAMATDENWAWVKVSAQPVALSAGRHALTLSTEDAGAHVDVVCLATDGAFAPQNRRPEDEEPPAPVSGLTAELVRDRAIHLQWTPLGEADLSHYNVYGSREPFDAPAQEYLLASPTRPEFIDWGLRAATTYHYAVTAVDRRGNESPLGAPVQDRTPADEQPTFSVELAFDKARLEGPLKTAQAQGTHADAYVILPRQPGDAAATGRASWSVEIPHEGDYYLWLRYLPRGNASVRAAAVRQDLRVLLDGERVGAIGGDTDLSVVEGSIRPEFWTWHRPVGVDLTAARLPRGKHTLTIENLTAEVRYDVLLITADPAFGPPDGRIRQR